MKYVHRANEAIRRAERDRKSTRLNSSHQIISYAVFCLKKKNTRSTSSHQIISYRDFCFATKQFPRRGDLSDQNYSFLSRRQSATESVEALLDVAVDDGV